MRHISIIPIMSRRRRRHLFLYDAAVVRGRRIFFFFARAPFVYQFPAGSPISFTIWYLRTSVIQVLSIIRTCTRARTRRTAHSNTFEVPNGTRRRISATYVPHNAAGEFSRDFVSPTECRNVRLVDGVVRVGVGGDGEGRDTDHRLVRFFGSVNDGDNGRRNRTNVRKLRRRCRFRDDPTTYSVPSIVVSRLPSTSLGNFNRITDFEYFLLSFDEVRFACLYIYIYL